jgi:hypothetical protein
MTRAPCFVDRQLDHLLGARGKADVSNDRALTSANDKFDGASHLGKFDAKIGQHFRCHAFAFSNEPKKKVLSTDVIVVKALRFFLS